MGANTRTSENLLSPSRTRRYRRVGRILSSRNGRRNPYIVLFLSSSGGSLRDGRRRGEYLLRKMEMMRCDRLSCCAGATPAMWRRIRYDMNELEKSPGEKRPYGKSVHVDASDAMIDNTLIFRDIAPRLR